MTGVLTVIGRFVIILLGYTAASLAASFFINVVFLAYSGMFRDNFAAALGGSLVFSIPFVALFVAYFAFLPSIAVMLIGELLGRRDWLFYALAGAVVGIAVASFFAVAMEPGQMPDSVLPVATLVGAGILGGIGYWSVAGRFAGSWRRRAVPTSPGR